MQEGLINTYKESGFFPEWASPGHRDCMIGNNSASVLADAYLKGIKVEDCENFVRRIKYTEQRTYIPPYLPQEDAEYEYYNKLGYVP